MQEFIASIEGLLLQIEPDEFWPAMVFCIVICPLSFYWMVRWYRNARKIENIPTAKIRSAAQGYIEIIGQSLLMDGPKIISPLTGKPCVWYHYKIEEKVRTYSSKRMSRSHWKVIKEQTSEELFLLEDATGQCIIDPDHADVITTHKRIWHKRLENRRFTEELLLENELLYAIGLFKSVANIEQKKIKEHITELLKQWKRDPKQLLHKFDSNRDGNISQKEWDRVRKTAEWQVKQQQKQQKQQTKMEQLHVLMNSPHNDQAFILSNISEKKLIKKYKLKSLFALISFFSSGSIAIWAINTRLGL
ncbi:MAG: hypothetical protein HRT92_03745 [Piscirickettsiaceae bacterium]|nr:hypothetical protein [Piscirickettsiaceae bacterium]